MKTVKQHVIHLTPYLCVEIPFPDRRVSTRLCVSSQLGYCLLFSSSYPELLFQRSLNEVDHDGRAEQDPGKGSLCCGRSSMKAETRFFFLMHIRVSVVSQDSSIIVKVFAVTSCTRGRKERPVKFLMGANTPQAEEELCGKCVAIRE